jgi:hypothetical protein
MTAYGATDRDVEALLALAWLAPLNSAQLHTLACPEASTTTFKRTVKALQARKWIDGPLLYGASGGRTEPPKRQGRAWQLIGGWHILPDDGRKPPYAAAIREAILQHDLTRAELITTIIHQARSVLSGISLELEARLDEAQPKPKADAILILRKGVPPGRGLPWVYAKPAEGEVLRGFAIEVDRDTEPLGTIQEKAEAYKRAAHDPAFYARYGHMPLPLWLVPDRKRAEQVVATWRAVWPEGRWYLLTERSLPRLVAVEYRAGVLRQTTLLEGWALDGEPTVTGQRGT